MARVLGLTRVWTHQIQHGPDYQFTITEAGLDPWFETVEGDRFQRIGHSLAAILHGVTGGVLAVWLANRARNREGERDGGVR